MDVPFTLSKIDAVMHEPGFVTTTKDFVMKHCEVFTDDLENRLEYTPIHEEYMATVEKHIEEGLERELGADFDMAAFMEALPAYMADSKSMNDGAAETIEFLTGFGEFENFKDMMLVAKRDKLSEGDGVLKDAPKGTSFSPEQSKVVQEAKEFCAELVATNDTEFWKTVVDKPWVKVERRSKPGQHEFVRISVTLDLELENAKSMICSFNKDRNNWDDFMTGGAGTGYADCETMEQFDGDSDRIVKITFRVPLAPTRTKHSRMLTTQDYPKQGEMTYMYLDWDPATRSLSSASESIGNGVLSAAPGDPSKTLYTSTHQIDSGWIPGFLIHWMMATFMPKQFTKQVLKYKKFKGLA